MCRRWSPDQPRAARWDSLKQDHRRRREFIGDMSTVVRLIIACLSFIYCGGVAGYGNNESLPGW